ncbi:MAG: hypothetical protein HY744_18230 [Deltaproteobacteria bacterium]|nr:hypothetical protein [Deltaproteobacteria bacterium]
MPPRRCRSAARILLAALVVLAALAAAPQARAAAGSQAAAAATLFKEGVALAKRGKYADAAAKLRASYEIDPARGTLLGLAMAEERAGQIAAAFGHYQELYDLARKAHDAAREKAGREGSERLERKIPKLVIAAERPARAGLRLSLDERPLPLEALGSALPIDPGSHTVKASAADGSSFEQTVTAEPATVVQIQIKLTGGSPGAGQGEDAGAQGSAPGGIAGLGWLRTAGIIAGGAGAVALGVGAGLWGASGNT